MTKMPNPVLRWVRHLWLDQDDVRRKLGSQGLKRLEAHVRASETRHTGELRLCVEGGLPWSALIKGQSPRSRALELFSDLRVWDTEHNNGVLIYLLLAEHRIEILADRGIMRRVGAEPWAQITRQLSQCLQQRQFEHGLIQAAQAVTELLTIHFPIGSIQDNANELADSVVVL